MTIKLVKRAFGLLLLAFAPLLLLACGGGGGGAAEVVKVNPDVAGSPKLGLVFVQNGQQLSYTDQGGIKTVTLNNAPFQVLIPDQKFVYVYLRASTNVTSGGIQLAGNVMGMDPRIEDIGGWQLKSVVPDDLSVNGFSYERTAAAGIKRSLNIQAIYQVRDVWVRDIVGKTPPGTLYFEFYLLGNPELAVAREIIKVILN